MREVCVIDALTGPEGDTLSGHHWQLVTDRLMGGESGGDLRFDDLDGETCLHLRGRVSTDSQGGFVQARLDLERDGVPLDAGRFRGLRVRVRGDGQEYVIALRTTDCTQAWQSYWTPIRPSAVWQSIELPFTLFRPYRLDMAFDRRRLTKLGLLAVGIDGEVDFALSRVEFLGAVDRPERLA
ncbi:CIA30 family protein [Marinivivus vitaminiproducens]|uniref:CIA30 family protein n=1 Tax=Marinivivus vitaminiproducens TaxID=3035935 RepID=UPI0027A1CFDE|nr:CIA30 family protein [Geminicoccaceae bacterium SCSIO 64248]